MAGRKLPQFSGHLAPAQVAEGINAASRNAKRLAEDARVLCNAERFASAASLAILSVEEAGKASILREIALSRTNEEARRAWKAYRSHARKNLLAGLPELVAAGARHLDDFRPLFLEGAEGPILVEQVKQLGFYTDCLGEAHWSEPAQVVDQRIAEILVRTAELLSRHREVSPREIELWVEHLGPVWRSELAWMKNALANWYAAMQAEGLEPREQSIVAQFIWKTREPEAGDEGGA